MPLTVYKSHITLRRFLKRLVKLQLKGVCSTVHRTRWQNQVYMSPCTKSLVFFIGDFFLYELHISSDRLFLSLVSVLPGSRYKMEYAIDKYSESEQNIDLSCLNLTSLYHSHYLSYVHTLDLSNNNLSCRSLPQLHPLQCCQVSGSSYPKFCAF